MTVHDTCVTHVSVWHVGFLADHVCIILVAVVSVGYLYVSSVACRYTLGTFIYADSDSD